MLQNSIFTKKNASDRQKESEDISSKNIAPLVSRPIKSRSDYDQLLTQFEKLCLQKRSEGESLDLSQFDLTQDDSKNFIKTMGSRSLSAPELNLPPSVPIAKHKLPFVFLFDPSASRAGQKRLASSAQLDPNSIEDDRLRAFYQRCNGLTFELFVESFSLFASQQEYTKELFIHHLKQLTSSFSICFSELEEGLSLIHQHYSPINRTFYNQILDALDYEVIGASRLQLFISLRKKNGGRLELISTDEGFQGVNSSTHDITSVHGRYSMVILEEHSDPKIYIGHGLHYNIARGSKVVLFAGNVEFNERGQIVSLDDHSGGYHGLDGESLLVRMKRKENLKQVLKEVGLPAHLFKSQFKEGSFQRLAQPPLENLTPILARRSKLLP